MPTQRVTVTLPPDVVQEIDRHEPNRSRFVLEAVEREIERRQRQALRRSLRNPHPESLETAEMGMDDWAAGLPDADVPELLEPSAGRPVRWSADEGWIEVEE